MSKAAARKPNRWDIALWSVQVFLAVVYASLGLMKVVQSPAELAALGWTWAVTLPEDFIAGLGFIEIAGAIGILLPAILRIRPRLTLVSAAGMTVVQVAAITLHGFRGETAETVPLNLVLLAASLFVLWGRSRKAPLVTVAVV